MAPMKLLHEELRKAREKAGLSQQALADRAKIPRNQVVRAERGENITVDTLRKIAAHLPVTELTLLDATDLRVNIAADYEAFFVAALQNVLRLASALGPAIQLAMDARVAVEVARRAAPPPPEGTERTADLDPILLLHGFARVVDEIQTLGKDAKIAS